MAAKILSFQPCNDWFFSFDEPPGRTIYFRLAGWAVRSRSEGGDEVVGMVSVRGGGANTHMPDVCRLVQVPGVEGTYLHQKDLPADAVVSSFSGNS